jgi:L-cysteine desulfidase
MGQYRQTFYVKRAAVFAGVETKAKSICFGRLRRTYGAVVPRLVVINAGSGNQGITVSLPVLVYAEH